MLACECIEELRLLLGEFLGERLDLPFVALQLLPMLDVQTLTYTTLEPQNRYALVAEGGLRAATATERASLSGTQWRTLQAALDDGAHFTHLLRAVAPLAAELKPQLRTLLQYHCGSPLLRTRQFMMDMQSL